MKHPIRILSLLLCVTLLCGAAPMAMAASPLGGYVEAELPALPGYIGVTSPAATPEGGFAVAAMREDTGAWELLLWSDPLGEPRAVPLAIEEGRIQSIRVAQDGQVLVVLDAFGMMTQRLFGEMDGADPSAEGGMPVMMTTDAEGLPMQTPDGMMQILGDPPEGEGFMLQTPDGMVQIMSDPPEGESFMLQTTDGMMQIMSDPAAAEGLMTQSAEDIAQRQGEMMQGGMPMRIEGGAPDTMPEGEGRAPRGDLPPIHFLMDSMENQFLWFDMDGQQTGKVVVPGMQMGIAALPGQRIAMLMPQAGVSIYDAQGAAVLEIARNDGMDLTAVPGALVFAQYDKLTWLDIQTGKELRSVPCELDYSAQLASTADGTLYRAGETGIWRLGAQDEAFVRMSDAVGMWIADPNIGFSSLCALPDGSLIAALGGDVTMRGTNVAVRIGGSSDMSGARLVYYRYAPDLDLSTRTDFTITALRTSAKLRKAAGDFQRAHPELNVSLRTMLAENDDTTPLEDALRTLNTDLLAGKGGDVLILDDLPLARYIDKGVLLPLDEVVAGIGFLDGILRGSTHTDGHLYAMPAQFTPTLLWGSADALAAAASLQAMTSMPLSGMQTVLSARTPEELLRLFFGTSQYDLRDEQGGIRFDAPAFEALLEAVYQLYAAQIDAVSPNDLSRGMDLSAMQALQNGAIAFFDAQLPGSMSAAFGFTAAGGEGVAACAPVPSLYGAGRAYLPTILAGISSQTQQPELAAEFVRSLFSPAVQELDQMEGLPTVASALDKLVADAKALSVPGGERSMVMMVSDGENTLEMQQPDAAIWDSIRALCDTLDQPYVQDETLIGFLVDETAAFFTGVGTAQQAAQAVQQRAAAYLNE